jgi:hypothetical protein
MQHELPESHTIGNGAPFPGDYQQIRAAFSGVRGFKRQLGMTVFGVFESEKRLLVTQGFKPSVELYDTQSAASISVCGWMSEMTRPRLPTSST